MHVSTHKHAKAWAHLQNIQKHLYNSSFSSTQCLCLLHATICYSRRARWPSLLALLRVQNATPCLLHTQIRARGPHRARNVAESAWTPYGSFCLCLRSTNSQAQAAHVSRLLEGQKWDMSNGWDSLIDCLERLKAWTVTPLPLHRHLCAGVPGKSQPQQFFSWQL